MAKGWKLYRNYDRAKFGAEVWGVLCSVNHGVRWLAMHTAVNKGTISAVLNGRRSCPPEHRESIIRALVAPLRTSGRYAEIDRLRALAGLMGESSQSYTAQTRREFMKQVPAVAPVGLIVEASREGLFTVGDRRPRGSSINDELLRDMRTACNLHHRKPQEDPQQILGVIEAFRSVASRAVESRNAKAEFRARLCIAYIHYGIDELKAAFDEVEDLVSEAAKLALDADADYWKIAAESEQLRGRIRLKAEEYRSAWRSFNESNTFLQKIGAMPSPAAGGQIPRVGHSFVVPHDVEIAATTIHAGNLHFQAKTSILEALREKDAGSLPATEFHDLSHKLRAAIDRDRVDPGPNLGFDMLLLSQLELDLEPGDAVHARKLLTESRDYFDLGAGRRDWHILSAHFAPRDRIARAMTHLESAKAYLSAFSLSGAAKVFDQEREVYGDYQPRHWRQRAFQFAFAAAVCHPYRSSYRRLREAARVLRHEERKPGEFNRMVEGLLEEVMDFDGKFDYFRNLLKALGGRLSEKLLHNAAMAKRKALH